MPRPNRPAAALAALLLLLLQAWAPMQAVAAMAAEVSALAAAESLCLHDEEGQARSGIPDSGRHHALCAACYSCCTVPVALPAGVPPLPLPLMHGRLRAVRIPSPPRRRAPGHRPNARGPPTPPERPCRHRTRISAGRDAGPSGDYT